MDFNVGNVYSAAIVLPVLGTFFVAARFYVRRIRETSPGADDFTILVGLLLTWGTSIAMIYGAANGAVGTHTQYNPTTGVQVSTATSILTAKVFFGFMVCFTLAVGCIKLSVLFLYRRIFITDAARWLSLGLCVLVGTWMTAYFFARVFQCGGHPSADWNPKEIKMYCLAAQDIDTSFAITDLITDFLVLSSSLPFIWQLHMSFSHKAMVTAILLLGLLATVAAATRLAFVVTDEYKTVTGHRDVQAIGTVQMMWAQIEAGVAIIAACLPTLRPLYMGKAPESLVNSIRSALSLGSRGSRGSGSRGSGDRNGQARSGQAEGVSGLTPANDSRVDTSVHASSAADEDSSYGMPKDAIIMHSSLVQQEDSKNAPVKHDV